MTDNPWLWLTTILVWLAVRRACQSSVPAMILVSLPSTTLHETALSERPYP